MQPEPIATYRLQMQPGFGFEQASAIIDYLSDLGVSHLYTSPFLQATSGSLHGYDIVDPTHINSELGSGESYQSLCEAIKNAGLGLMIDSVPNHMAILGKENPWWWDVLENGHASHYAAYFDVDWDSSEEHLSNKVLLPLLGDHYGRVLENKEFTLSFEKGQLTLHYHDKSFPIDPSSLSGILNEAASVSHSELLAFIAENYDRLPKSSNPSRKEIQKRQRNTATLRTMLERLCFEEPAIQIAIQNEIDRINKDCNALDVFIELQNYRLSYWRLANQDLGYRRFFDIKELVGLLIEDSEVFRITHALPITWFLKGWVQGLRIDHPDGLRNPTEYFNRLQESCPGAWIVAEKILARGEKLPTNWKIQGTTGYDFLNLLNGLFIDPNGKYALTKLYEEITKKETDFNQLVYECKLLVLNELFGSELNRLSTLFVHICERHRRYRDYTKPELSEALSQTAACFPVYRTYLSSTNKRISNEDEIYVNMAIDLVFMKCPNLDHELIKFLRDLLLLRIPGQLEEELALRFQQLTGAVMAKGFEDTALYRYHRLIALNEVGGDPSQFHVPLNDFHQACQTARLERPLSLLASTTHDTKRSEDVRARLTLLSEIPDAFQKAVLHWMDLNQKFHLDDLPDTNTEYLIYQTLIGVWPISEERMLIYIEKAIRESKEFTSWLKSDQRYENGIKNFVREILKNEIFISDFENFVNPLINPGRVISLAQTLIKLTAPGIPDIYQGSELWNLTLVDPDNRHTVDFTLRRKLIKQLLELNADQIVEKIDEGLPKLFLIQQTLHLRKKFPEFFSSTSSYKPLYAEGCKKDHVIAFMRGETIIIVTPRYIMRLNNDWSDTILEFPEGIWHNIFTKEKLIGGKLVRLNELFIHFPVALFFKE